MPTNVYIVKTIFFLVVLDGRKSWTIKKAEHQRIDAFKLWCRQRLESLLDSEEIKPVDPKENQLWIFIGRTYAKAEAPILWPPDAKSQLIGKDSDAGKDWDQEDGVTEDEMVGWHHQLIRHEFEHTLGDSDGEGSLMCYSPWGHKKLEMIYWLDQEPPDIQAGFRQDRGTRG